MEPVSLIAFLLIGLLAGWLASKIIPVANFGLIAYMVVGVVGSFIGGVVFSFLGIAVGGLFGSIVAAVVGALILLFLVKLVRK